MSKTLGVKEIAYFVHASGNLTNEFSANRDQQEGHRAHVFLQSKYGESSKKERYVKKEVTMNGESFLIHGFVDGVLEENSKYIIEEIKSTKLELEQVGFDYHTEYFAQLKLYAYLFGIEMELSDVHLRLTFISTITYEVKSFDTKMSIDTLEDFFFQTVESYLKFYSQIEEAEENRLKTIAEIKFPFTQMRKGQRDLMAATFQTMTKEDVLYCIAPTGIGKTMATMFASIKTLTTPADKLFYLTAKGMGKKVAEKAVTILYSQGLRMKSIVLTAKAKCCQLEKRNCNPEACPFAKGFFSRLRNAITDIFNYDGIYNFDAIKEYADKHQICAFEFSLNLSNYCDLIIADYNYAFDPKAHLIRYFDDSTYRPKILVDEAHNLIDRSKEMFSATIDVKTLERLRLSVNGIKPTVRKEINKAIEHLEEYDKKLTPQLTYYQEELDKEFVELCFQISRKCEQILADNQEFDRRETALESYFVLYDFLRIADIYDTVHRTLLTGNTLGNFTMTLRCFDASKFLYEIIKNAVHGIVFFSATLFPIKYHMDLLTGGIGKYMDLESPFKKENLSLLIGDQISTKYNDRAHTLDDIIATIEVLTQAKAGNYIVFFPSYAYQQLVLDHIESPLYETFVQKPNMTEEDRDKIFNQFFDTTKTKVGFFVMGGVFSEGLDYIGDLLSGVIIVGVGIPQICLENDLAKEYFETIYGNGFDYAYTYPGFNKVVQAAGRVIRTETDRGVVILLDSRYRYRVYQGLMPSAWSHRKYFQSPYQLKKELEKFWEE